MSDTKARLRSESTPDPGRVARVMESRRAAMAERAALDEEFMARVTKELSLDDSATTQSILRSAASAHVEVSVLTAKFLRCCATTAEMERLAAARGQLLRALRALGATPKGPPGDDDVPTVREYIASRARPELADK